MTRAHLDFGTRPRWGDHVTVDGYAVVGLVVDLLPYGFVIAFPSGKEIEAPFAFVRTVH